jgi:protein-L-isoaspartate O-methyltransferase
MGNKKSIEKGLEDVLMSTIRSENFRLMPDILVDIFFQINDCNHLDYDKEREFKRYLRAIAQNIRGFETIKVLKEKLNDCDAIKRLEFLAKMGGIVTEFFYGHSTDYYKNLDKSVRSFDETRTNNGHYHYIALSNHAFVTNFLRSIYEIYGHRESFIDVGCGIGDKTLLAWLSGLFDKCYGIEYSQLTYEIAFKSFERLGLYDRIISGDAFEHNFEPYDTIYFYCPISDTEGMHKLYKHIFGQIKRGSVMKEMLPESGMHNFLKENETSTRYVRGDFIQKSYSRKHKKFTCKIMRYPYKKVR